MPPIARETNAYLPCTVPPPRRGEWIALAAICAVGLALRIGLAEAFPVLHHPDELYQYLEPAHRLSFGAGVETWEYRAGTRSWLLPGLVAGLMRIVEPILGGPEGYLAAVRAAMATLSLSVVAVAFLWGRRTAGTSGAVIAGGCAAVWIELVYFAPRTLTEVAAAHVLVVALYLLRFPGAAPSRRFAWAGALLALALVLRIQIAPALFVAAAWACRAEWKARWAPLLGAGTAVLLGAGLLDWATWSYPFQGLFLNVWVNLVQAKADDYGVDPLPWYGWRLLQTWRWALVPLALGLVVARREAMAVAVALTIVVAHSAIGHKEYRFVFPAIVIVVLLAGLGTAAIVRRVTDAGGARRALAVAAALLLWTGVSAGVATNDRFRIQFGDLGWKTGWYRSLAHASDLCGLLISDINLNITMKNTNVGVIHQFQLDSQIARMLLDFRQI